MPHCRRQEMRAQAGAACDKDTAEAPSHLVVWVGVRCSTVDVEDRHGDQQQQQSRETHRL
jgi:hypothetical protein